MYEKFWNLQAKPFETTPDPRFVYYSKDHEDALFRLFYTIKEQKGAMLLTGGYGCGKTVLSRLCLNELVNGPYEIALLPNPLYNARDLLAEIVYQLGGESHRDKSKSELLRYFNEIVYENVNKGQETVIVIDDAQAIEDLETFEELRLLLNFQQNDRHLLTLILIGQPELRKKLQSLPQLMQRLAIRYHINNLSEDDTVAYINHRLRVAGAQSSVFSDGAKHAVFEFTGGVPRCINSLADMALLTAFEEERDFITSSIIRRVAHDINMGVTWSDSLM